MEYAKLGKTDIEVSKLAVGCMSFGKAGTMHDWTLDEDQTEAVVKRALDLGINFFDTANCYSEGTSEEYLGRALKKNISRDKVVIASKVYFNPGRLSKDAIAREIDGSLKRLGTDYLDLYIIHRFDYDTPVEETMEALDRLVKAGKVRALGASAMFGYQFYNYAARGARQRLREDLRLWKPLQPAEPRRGAGDDPDLPPDGSVPDPVQPARRRTPVPTDMGL